jgi:hypothetical protein
MMSHSGSPLLPPELADRVPLRCCSFDSVIVDSVGLKIDAYLQIYADEPREKLDAIFAHQRCGGVTRHHKFRHFETESRPRGHDATSRTSPRPTGSSTRPWWRPFVAGARRCWRTSVARPPCTSPGTPHEEL